MSEEIEKKETHKRKVGRSPAYPAFDIRKALDRARQILDQEGEYAAPLSSVTTAWGYSSKSSGARQTLSTLKYYGLIEVQGEGDLRKVKVSDIALRILLDEREDDTEKRQLIKKVALNPSAHKTIYDQYPSGLTSDGSITHFLMFEAGFKKDAANELLAEFKQTADFVELYEPNKNVDKTDNQNHNNGSQDELPDLMVGDKIQWTNQGVDQFPSGGTVMGLSEEGQWVFTDQGSGAVPISEVTVMENASTRLQNTPPSPPPHIAAAMAAAAANAASSADVEVKTGSRKAVFPVEDGDVTIIFPEGLSTEGLEELGEYLEIFLRKEKKKQMGGA